jgi:hypothetical protein
MQLLTIQPDGSFATQPILAFDFDRSNCAVSCNDPSAGYVPNEVVPDGQAGALATWTGNDSQLGITSSSEALVRHFDNAGGTLDYVMPFASQRWFRQGNNNPQGLVIGENNVAFGSDGQSIIAFDVNTGIQQRSFQPSGFQGSSLLASAEQGIVVGVQLTGFQGNFDAAPNALLSIDPNGSVSTIPFSAGNAPVAYFDANSLAALSMNGQGELVQSVATDLNAGNPWNLPDGNLCKQRNENLPKIEFDKQISFIADDGTSQTLNVPLIGIANQQTESVRISSNEVPNPSTNFAVRLTLQTLEGTSGSATFGDGTTDMTVTPSANQPIFVQIRGVSPSSTADNIRIIAKVNGAIAGSHPFSVVSVAVSIAASGTIADDNTAKDDYLSQFTPSNPDVGTPNFTGLGAFATDKLFSCGVGVQFTGSLTPSNYAGKVVLRRTLLKAFVYDGADGSVFVSCPSAKCPTNDTSPDQSRDDSPQSSGSNGKVYDLDAPGPVNVFPSGTLRRFRGDFSEYAVLDNANNNVVASAQLPWFARVSCMTDDNDPRLISLISDVAGDNSGGQGTTALTVSLK